jgi:hypothetical protein
MGIGGLQSNIRIVPICGTPPLTTASACLPPQAEAISFPGIAVHILVERFSVFGVQVQYWMLVAVLIVAAAVAFDVWRG